VPSDVSDPDRDVLSRETDEWERWAAKHLPRQRDRRRLVNCEKAPAGRIQAVARNPEQVRPGPRQQPAPGVGRCRHTCSPVPRPMTAGHRSSHGVFASTNT
jgi:hypothetical protein